MADIISIVNNDTEKKDLALSKKISLHTENNVRFMLRYDVSTRNEVQRGVSRTIIYRGPGRDRNTLYSGHQLIVELIAEQFSYPISKLTPLQDDEPTIIKAEIPSLIRDAMHDVVTNNKATGNPVNSINRFVEESIDLADFDEVRRKLIRSPAVAEGDLASFMFRMPYRLRYKVYREASIRNLYRMRHKAYASMRLKGIALGREVSIGAAEIIIEILAARLGIQLPQLPIPTRLEDTKQVGFVVNLPGDLHKLLSAHCHKEQISQNSFVISLINRAAEREQW